MTNTIKFTAITMMLLVLNSCSEDHELQPSDYKIIDNASVLSGRMSYQDDTIPVTSNTLSSDRVSKGKKFDLILKSSLEAPEIDGERLQASSIVDFDGGFLVGYNFRGNPYKGSIDHINSGLKLMSQVVFYDMDVHAVYGGGKKGKRVFFAGASGAAQGAVTGSLGISGKDFFENDFTEKSLGSFAANSITQWEDYLLVTTGDDENDGGGLYVLDEEMNQLHYKALHDARWVTVEDDLIVVVQGTPGQISIFEYDDDKLQLIQQFGFQGADVPQSKSTLSIDDELLFVAAGTSGVHLFDLESGRLMETLTFDEDNAITNAVAAEDELLFISNGEAGVFVAEYDDEAGEMELLGKLELSLDASVNHISQKGNRLYVAAGLDGVQMIDIRK